MSVNIFLDDYRVPEDVYWQILPKVEYVIVRSYEEFVDCLLKLEEEPAFVAFDHDLADAHYTGDFSNPNEKTGYDCAKELVTICQARNWKLPEFIVHSLNFEGRRNIEQYLANAKRHLKL